MSTKYFNLLPHTGVKQILPGIYTVTGTMKLFGLFQYSRVMTILKDENSLALVNPVRVNEETLSKIKELGEIDHIFKIGQLHNVDIPFYIDKFSPKLWVNKDDPSVKDSKSVAYFEDGNELPILNCKVKLIEDSKIKEAILISPADGGCLHSCDAFVNMGDVDPMHNWLTAKLSKLLSNPTYIGPNWVKIAKPPQKSMESVLDFEFESFVPAHGEPIMKEAKKKLKKYLSEFYA